MLRHLAIKNFAIVDELQLDCASGMTVISGETGAGKSIMLDALGLCLGDRADAKAVQPGAKRAEICADFAIDSLPAVSEWLSERELDQDGDCLLRRTIGADGRSRAFINGRPSTLVDCAELGELLVDIHSQHSHQSLLRTPVQGALLDGYANAGDLADATRALATEWREMNETLEQLCQQSDGDRARRDLLTYQVEELDGLALGEGELAELERQQQQLANATFIIESASQGASACEQQADQLRVIAQDLDDSRHLQTAVANVRELIAGAQIQLDEARQELGRYVDGIETDPERLHTVTQRLDAIYDLARKHRVMPEQLVDHHQHLSNELATLDSSDERIDGLREAVSTCAARWQAMAGKLTRSRREAAKALAEKTMATLGELAMERCKFEISLKANDVTTPQPQGAERIEFLIATNPGAELGPLARIASGGELSRISLALQVAAAEVATSPTMVFDEVDVGIGGGTAEVVGELLRSLSERIQVICVTHQPQVAAKGHHHFLVRKSGDEERVAATMQNIEESERVEEVARMLGGRKITNTTRLNARELLAGT